MYRQSFVAISLAVSVASAQHGALQTVERDGKPVATYYAVEPHLRTALAQMSEYFPRFSGQSFRLWVDCLLPLDLKELGYEPAEVLTRRWVREFFKDQHPKTGLIPLGGPPRPSRPLYTILDQSKCMFMRTIDQATLFMPWVADDAAYRGRCVTLAEGFMKHFRVSIHHGLFSAVRADTGFPESAFTNVSYYGSATVGLARIGAAAERQDLLDRAKHIARWVSDFAMRYCRGIVPEKFHAAGGFPNDLSSDGIYWVRAMGRAYAATGDEFYRSLVLKHGNVYFENGWCPEHRHFSTHVKVDYQGIHPVGSMYGDTKYNYPYLLCLLTRLTRDPKYMQRFDVLWETFMREAHHGWVPSRLMEGRRQVRKGQPIEDQSQSNYLGILLDAYETTRDAKYLALARDWAAKLLTPDGKAHWRGDSVGAHLIRYARHAKLISRLEIRLPAPGGVSVHLQPPRKAPERESVLTTQVPTSIAVVYLAPGQYTIRATGCRDVLVELSAEEQKTVLLKQ